MHYKSYERYFALSTVEAPNSNFIFPRRSLISEANFKNFVFTVDQTITISDIKIHKQIALLAPNCDSRNKFGFRRFAVTVHASYDHFVKISLSFFSRSLLFADQNILRKINTFPFFNP